MRVEITPITKLQYEKVHFHSVRVCIDDNPKRDSEFKDFYNRMKLNAKNSSDFQELMVFAEQIGTIYGAIDRKFKKEDKAERLNQPLKIIEVENEKGNGDYGLRLYCIRIDEHNVILFNGDRKTVSGDIMGCENCKPYFLRANTLATAILNAFASGDFRIEDKFKIIVREGFTLNVDNYGQRQH
ncbi:MAG: hypothetical protein U0U70_13245 [Chitinophagaceae bacterium]